jgi:hypothetical protein
MRLNSQRHLFDMPDEVAYLNCTYLGAALARRARSRPGGRRPQIPALADPSQRLLRGDRDGAGAVRRADRRRCAGHRHCSIRQLWHRRRAVNLPARPGQRIVPLDGQFPSNVYPWRDLAERSGADVVTVARPADLDWTRALLNVIDERTAVVALPQCHWTDGSLINLAQVSDRARALGAALVVDATQSASAHPLDIGTIRPDFLVAAA